MTRGRARVRRTIFYSVHRRSFYPITLVVLLRQLAGVKPTRTFSYFAVVNRIKRKAAPFRRKGRSFSHSVHIVERQQLSFNFVRFGELSSRGW